MENINKYIGIPHYFNESSFAKCDCIGLVKLFYKEHNWITIDDGQPITETWQDNAMSRIMRWFSERFDVVRDPSKLQYGSVVLFKVAGDYYHMGVYLEYGKVLAMQVPVVYGKTTSTIYHRNWWTPHFKIGFNRREQ